MKGNSSKYVPPFVVSQKAINLIAEITARLERYKIRIEQKDGLKLRRANRIKTIQSSLAIEGNTLSENQVRDIIDGKNVIAPLKQIQEVKNAIKTYELYPLLDAFKEEDLLKAHGVMMLGLLDNPGNYRNKEVGVYGAKSLVHIAPPAGRVSFLMKDLFKWLKESKDHLLIRSCVFHYEFEFIHPFLDGNGRMGRLWQSLILGKLNPLFEYIPIENMVYANQHKYYKALADSNISGECGPFIDFMLNEVFNAIKANDDRYNLTEIPNKTRQKVPNKIQQKVPNKIQQKVPNKIEDKSFNLSQTADKVLKLIKKNNSITALEAASILNLSDRIVRKHIAQLKKENLIVRVGSNKNGFWKIIKR